MAQRRRVEYINSVMPLEIIISLWNKGRHGCNFIEGRTPLAYYLYPMGDEHDPV